MRRILALVAAAAVAAFAAAPAATKPQPLRFFCLGESYEFWGMIEGSFHFVCPPKDGTFFLLGTDRLGRDMFSRIVYAARISLTIGIIASMFAAFAVSAFVQRLISAPSTA